MNIVLVLLKVSVALVMAVQVNFYFNSVFGKETSKANKWMYSFAFIVINVAYLYSNLSWQWSSLLGLAIIFCLSLGYEVGFRVRLLFSFLYTVLLTLVNTFCLFILNPQFSTLNESLSLDLSDMAFTTSLLLSCIVMFAVILVIRLIAKRRSYSLHLREFILVLIVPVIIIYQVNVLILYSEKNIHYFISVLGFIILNILVVYILDTVIARFQLKHENNQLQRQMDYQDSNYEKSVHSFKKLKSVIHDTNQQFLFVKACIDEGRLTEASEHIKVSLDMIEHAYMKVNTGHLAIDALVTNALNIAHDNGIRVDTVLRLFSSELGIERYDLCVVLGNMLDNAIEASKKVKVAADRYIKITIHSNETALFINIYNRVEREIVDLQSRKANPEFHGFGLTNIRRICEKYGGHMTIETKALTFNNMVALPFSARNSHS